ncbi:MAG TPA: Hachiman antiphage defense system protein HamA [Candidatus Paceibacterota bacterium]
MSTQPSHCSWFENAHRTLRTADGKDVPIINFNHQQDEAILTEWALHLRRHYSSDADLEAASTSMGMSRSDYLRDIKFPNNTPPGPSIRSGDFSEILVADYIQFLLNYDVPRTRYDRKATPNSSTQGTDILAFKFSAENIPANDELITCEIKGSLRTASNSLQDAIDDSKKDFETRLPIALNATLQRLKDRGETESIRTVERFMNKTSNPYKQITGAFLVCSNGPWADEMVTESDSSGHPSLNTFFMVFTGVDLMDLANTLYEKAYATA